MPIIVHDSSRTVDATPELAKGTFKGHPMIEFRLGKEDKYPFAFGKGKAAKLLAAMKHYGATEIQEVLEQFVNG